MTAIATNSRTDVCLIVVELCTNSCLSLSRFPWMTYLALKMGSLVSVFLIVITNPPVSMFAPSGTSTSMTSFRVPRRIRSSISFVRTAFASSEWKRGSFGLSISVICTEYGRSFRLVGLDTNCEIM